MRQMFPRESQARDFPKFTTDRLLFPGVAHWLAFLEMFFGKCWGYLGIFILIDNTSPVCISELS